MEVYVARQPIFTRNRKIYGYELLFRGGMINAFPDIDGDTATSKVLSNTFFTMGMDHVVGRKRAFINFTQDLLLQKVPMMFPREKVTVEVLEDVSPEPEVVSACREMGEKGYEIALDDFLYRDELRPLIQMANIIKIDFMATSPEEISRYVEKLSPYGVKFLAEKVETHEEFQRALDMGFTYFQGYFFSKPQILAGRDISPSKINLMQMVAEVNKEDMKFEELEKTVTRDVSITYKLLRYMNSAYFKRMQEITSIKQAMVLLGQKGVRRFISLIIMAKLASDKPDELLRISIIRARMCELLGKDAPPGVDASELFILGLFSLIDAILDEEMGIVMEKLPISDTVKSTLVNGEGQLSAFLNLVRAYEGGDWESFIDSVSKAGVNEEKVPGYYMDAVGWADSMSTI
jgi:c-di-GMP-related signal transduction protein